MILKILKIGLGSFVDVKTVWFARVQFENIVSLKIM